MKLLALFIGFNLTTCGAAIPAGTFAWHHLPLPAAPIVLLFLTTAWAGVLFVTFLWLVKATFDPANPK